MSKPILVLDFDGVVHSYTSGWQGADIVSDPPVPGALGFIEEALRHFRVAIFSSRSNQAGGIDAMRSWLTSHFAFKFAAESGIAEVAAAPGMVDMIEWPTEKPPALITIDDRAITFTGEWPTIEELKAFKPWNKR